MTTQPPDNDDNDNTRMLDLADVRCSTDIADYLTAPEIEELRAELTAAHERYSSLLSQPTWLRGAAEFRCAEISGWRHRLLAGLVPDVRRRSLLQTSQPKRDWVDTELPLLSELRRRYRMAWEVSLSARTAARSSRPAGDEILAEAGTEARSPGVQVQNNF